MAAVTATVNANRLNHEITMLVTIRGLRVVKARWWFAYLLLRAARFVAGCQMSIEVGR